MKMIRPFFLLFVLLMVSSVFAEEVKDYNSLLSDGVIKLNENNLKDAHSIFKQAIAQDTKGIEAYYYLGVVEVRMNLPEEAEASFKKALALDPLFIPAHYDLGVLYYAKKNDEAALASFDMVQKADPDRARVYFYQGLILRRLGKFKEAATKFEEAARRDPSSASESLHQAGEAYLQADDITASKEALQKVIAIDGESRKAKEAQDFLKNLDIPIMAQSKGKQWSTSLLTGLLYDDNVILDPSGIASQTATSTDDTVIFLSAKGRYQWTPNKNVEYRFYQNYHKNGSFRNFDIQDHNLSFHVRPKDTLNLDYYFQLALLGRKHYLTYNTLGAQYLYAKSESKVTELSYQLQVKRFYNTSEGSNNEDRNALGHQVGIRHAVTLPSEINLRGSYLLEVDRAGSSVAQDDWSFIGHRLKTGITLPVWRKLTTTLDLEYSFRPYAHENESSLGTKRRDTGNFFNLSLSRPLGERVSLVFSYLNQRNHSNISNFDYSRSVYGILAIARF